MNVKERLDEKGVSPVIGVILMVVVTVIMAAILSGFIFSQGKRLKGKPTASIVVADQPGTAKFLVLKHQGGSAVDWDDLRLSCTLNADSPTAFESPVDNNDILSSSQTDGDQFVAGESVLIANQSDGAPLDEDDIYHVVVRHEPSGTALLDANVTVTSG